ncbi:homing endonuclease associated repeat-containing protein [Halomarina salina]|uniref:Homing endonuclease associated repeat-containing protein n=1 Tax=Halomarina salina TaxID=1872699 RepID=A0ABD5RNX4_9EURY|nr:HNH endonuclease [Halomarina salina]
MSGISADELIEALCELAEEVGGTPTRTQMNEQGRYSGQPYYTKFGSWNDALKAAGMGPNHRNTVPEEELIEELRRVAEEVERVPRMADMDEHGRFSASAYHRRFGSWPAARKAAGLQQRTETTRKIGREALLSALVELAEDVGRPPSQEEMNQSGEYCHRPYYREFGTWGTALEAAGLDPNAGRSQATSDENLLRALRELATELGRTPTFDQVNELGEYSIWPYIRAFGSHNEAVEAAGLSINKEHGTVEGTVEYGVNWATQRLKALERDDWVCQDENCEMTDHEHRVQYGQGLDVHHLQKVRTFDSLGTANQLENLVSLCRSCHVQWENRMSR